MKALRIRNLRSLTDTGFIELKPVTLLLGQNSSGKSTFMRSLPLLRQSIESRTTGPILWFGRFVDFGSFQEAIWRSAVDPEISFQFQFNVVNRTDSNSQLKSNPLYTDIPQDLEIDLTLYITGDSRSDTSWASGCTINFAREHLIDIRYERDGRVTKFTINGRDFSDSLSRLRSVIMKSGLIPTLLDRNSEMLLDRGLLTSSFSRGGILFDLLFNNIRSLVHKNTHDETIYALAQSLRIGTSETMLHDMQTTPRSTGKWEEISAYWTINSSQFKNIRDLVIANAIPGILSSCDDYISMFATNNRYIAPVRATAERYYRLQDLAVDEVDFQGQNLPMFLRNLTSTELRNFSEWTERNFGFSAEVSGSGGHISLKLRERGSGHYFNMADKGFGFSQMLPILTQLWIIGYQRSRRARSPLSRRGVPVTFSIEQPELHLHPYLQSQLMDSFVASIDAAREVGIDLRLLLETHSETMVNRVGHLVNEKSIENSKINVVLFEKRGADEPTIIKTSTYNEKGYLSNWPLGFFDPI